MEKKGSPFSFPPDLHTIFVDTNIDTHLAMVVSLHDTISDVKAKIMAEHALCFEDIGEISIRAIKVKQRGFFYTLADSMCVWNAFHGFKTSWIVYIDAAPKCSAKSPEIVADKATDDHLEHHFNGTTISLCEPEKRLGHDGQGSHNSTVMSRDHEGRPEMLIDQNKDDGKNLGDETINGMHVTCTRKTKSGKRSRTSEQDNLVGSQSQHYLVEKKRGKKAEEGFHADNLQNHPVEQHKKRKRKSSKWHEEAHLAAPSETLVSRSSAVTLDSYNSGEHGGRHIRMAPGTASSFEVTNKKEKDGHSMETCMVVISSGNREPIEDQVLQANLQDQRERHVSLAQETNGDVRHKETEEIRISSSVHYELPFKSYCSTDTLMSPSSMVLEHQELNNQQNRELDAAKCMTELNPRKDEAGPVDERKGPPSLDEKFSHEDQDTNGVSKKFLFVEHQCFDKGTDAAANLKGADKDRSLIQVNSKVLHKSRRRKKKLKTESSRACESTEINGDQENFNSNSVHVSLNDVHHEYNAAQIIKPADLKTNGEHCADTISLSSKDVPNQEQVSHLNSGNPSISMPHSLSEVSNLLVEQTSENIITQPEFEVQSTPWNNKKMLKREVSKLGSPGISDVVLVKSNEQIIGCNEVGGFDPSKLANRSKRKLVQHCIDARSTVSLSDEDFSKLAKISEENQNQLELSSCKQQDLGEQSNVKFIIKDGDLTHVLSHGTLADPTRCNCERKKSKKEVLGARVSSEMSENKERCEHGDAGINFGDYFVSKKGKHTQNVPTADSPTDLVHSASHKCHVVESLPQDGDTSRHSAVDAAHDATIKDCKPRNAEKAQNAYQSGKRKSSCRIGSNSSQDEVNEYQKLVKKLGDYGTKTHFQLPKLDGLESKQKITEDGKETPSLPLDGGIGNMVSNDGYVRCKSINYSTNSNPVGNAVGLISSYVSPSEEMSNQVASSDSTEDTPYHLKRFRVVRKIPIRRSKSRTDNP